FHYKCLHYRHSVNSKHYAKEQAELAETNILHMNRRDDGSFFLTGFLDPIGGAVVRSALEPLARPLGKDDHRPRPQRMADALVELAGHQQTIQMQVTSSIETLLDLTGAPGAESEFSLPISSKTVERWACDCSLTRVLRQDSVVIDVGRAERTIKGPRRRALNARDQHCRWPGCERPASWCDGHHIVYVMRGGGDELENLVFCAPGITGWCMRAGGSWSRPTTAKSSPSRRLPHLWGSPRRRRGMGPSSGSDNRQLLPAQAPLIAFVQRMKAASLAQYLARDPVVGATTQIWDSGRVQAPKQTARAFGRPA